MRRLKIQLALDTTDLDKALSVANQVVDLVDTLEIGTLLLHQHGMGAIQAIRSRFPDADIVADLKIMDCGEAVTRMALEAGANGVIVQVAAPRETLLTASNTARICRGFITADTLGVYELSQIRERLRDIDIASIIVHKGKDEQAADDNLPLDVLEHVLTAAGLPPISVAGGISHDNVSSLMGILGLHSIIIGQAIMRSATPRAAVSRIRALCKGA
jgi:3-keto-L-gulonate-6-phosphate decarboxylase